jgi:hypothetical protein
MSLLFGSFKKFIADKSCDDIKINMKGFDVDGKTVNVLEVGQLDIPSDSSKTGYVKLDEQNWNYAYTIIYRMAVVYIAYKKGELIFKKERD